MFRKVVLFAFLASVVFAAGCRNQPPQSRVALADEIRDDVLASNIITRPILQTTDFILGRGMVVTDYTRRRNDAGFTEVQVQGYSQASQVLRFQYQFEWIDADGFVMDSKTNVWRPYSVTPKAQWSIRGTAPRTEAVDFRLKTRNWE